MAYEFTKAKIKSEKAAKLKSQLFSALVFLVLGAAGTGIGYWLLSWNMPYAFIPGIVLAAIFHSVKSR